MTRPVTRIVPLLVLLASACSRPEVNVPREEGKAGMFCVTGADCGGGLSCTDGRCCGSNACAATCAAIAGAEAPLVPQDHAAVAAQSLRRRCLTLCCTGRTEAEIRSILGEERTMDGDSAR